MNVDEFFDNYTTDGTDPNLEMRQDEEDPIRSPQICEYDFGSSEIDEGKTFYNVNEDDGVSDGRYFDDLMAYFDETDVDIKYDISAPVQNMEECNLQKVYCIRGNLNLLI